MDGVHEKQGYLEDLDHYNTAQLQELLKRQQATLKNSGLLKKLPDKGEKIKKRVALLESLLAKRKEEHEHTANLFQKLSLEAEQQRYQLRTGTTGSLDPLREIASTQQVDKVYISEESQTGEPHSHLFTNCYQKILNKEKHKAEHKEQAKGKFLPHSSIKTEHIDDLQTPLIAKGETVSEAVHKERTSVAFNGDSRTNIHSDIVHPSEQNEQMESVLPGPTTHLTTDFSDETAAQVHVQSSSPGGSVDRKLRFHYDEALMIPVGNPKSPAKLIDLEEAAVLMKDQEKQRQILQARLAGERLSQRLGISFKNFNPEGTPASALLCQVAADEEDSDSESEIEGIEYPD